MHPFHTLDFVAFLACGIPKTKAAPVTKACIPQVILCTKSEVIPITALTSDHPYARLCGEPRMSADQIKHEIDTFREYIEMCV